MRILAIRGENLASLADPFEVDFEAEPIRGSGIFAITGPTGAGKTTLLDAVCLALFDKLPRLQNADRGASVGRPDSVDQIRYDDVRGILRHGASAAYAEVDFVGQDARQYRSRWEVNRARGRADGKLQAQKITLTDTETGQIIGDKKTDTLHEVEQRIGLNFDQFRRSVLLAQGDFETFIKASSKDRAELLERITGTEIYSRLSRAAFELARREHEALHDLETQLGQHRPLSDEERLAAAERANVVKSDLDRFDAQRMCFSRAQDWYKAKDSLEALAEEGHAALIRARESDLAAEANRADVARAKKAFSLRAELEAASASSTKLATADEKLAEAVETEQKAVEARDDVVSVSTIAKTARDEASAAYAAIGLELDRAKQLETLAEGAKKDLASWKESLDRSVLARSKARDAGGIVERTLKLARSDFDNDARWLEEHRSVEPLVARIEEIVFDLSQWISLQTEVASTSEAVELLKRQATSAGSSRQAKEPEISALKQQERKLGDGIKSYTKIADEIDKGAAEAKRDTITQIQTALKDAWNATDRARKAREAIVLEDQERSKQDDLMREARDTITRIDAEMPASEAHLEEAKRSLELSEAAGSEAAEHLRLRLQDGQPCPVCGATEHLVAEVDRLLKDREEADREHVAECEATLSTSHKTRSRAETQIVASERALQGILRRRSGDESDFAAASESRRISIMTVLDCCRETNVLAPTFAQDAALLAAAEAINPFQETLARTLEEAREAIQRVTEAEAQMRQLSADRETVRGSLESASAEIAKLRDEEQTKGGEAKALDATLQSSAKSLEAVSSRLGALLRPVFPAWAEEVAELEGEFAERCRSLVDGWQRRLRTADAAGAEIARLEADLEGKRATLKASEAAAAEAEQRHTGKQDELDRLLGERASVIGGRPVGEVRTEYRKRSETAEKAWTEAEATRFKTEQFAATRSSGVVTAREAVDAAKTDQESKDRVLTEKLRNARIGREQAEAAIARGEAWVQEEETRLHSLREAVTTAATTESERKDAVERHRSAGRPDLSREDVHAALAALEAPRSEAADRYIRAISALQQDDETRSRIGGIQAALEKRQEEARVWAQLDELIGSADGTKFRRFAQSLTLNQLIQLANRHLADLNPRYELQRAPGGDLVLQVVDRDMADEVRGVHSLSGGERFLVSLSLALGLASMSSSRGIMVESLFIDEGFSALDANSVSMAVSVLENLQATGRRVGVISHVDELKERMLVRIEITPVGGGRSTVQVVTA